MRAVLGIDAAWSENNRSGVALVIQRPDHWRVVATDCCYSDFLARQGSKLAENLHPNKPDVKSLLAAAANLCDGAMPCLIAVDMPLSYDPILSRRIADNAISTDYGGRWCSTHTPSAVRPGRISDNLRTDCELCNYPLRTGRFNGRGLVEVYPHPALVELARAPHRLEYKYDKRRKYWPRLSNEKRKESIFQVWDTILDHLECELSGARNSLGHIDRYTDPKGYEDAIDGLVCAWVGRCVIEGRAKPYGDDRAAIWVPLLRDRWVSTQ
jgi:predicted RNase H-like nuclease